MDFEERMRVRGGSYQPGEGMERSAESYGEGTNRMRPAMRETQRQIVEMADRGREAVSTMRERMAGMGEGIHVQPWMRWTFGLFTLGAAIVAAIVFFSPRHLKNRMWDGLGEVTHAWRRMSR